MSHSPGGSAVASADEKRPGLIKYDLKRSENIFLAPAKVHEGAFVASHSSSEGNAVHQFEKDASFDGNVAVIT